MTLINKQPLIREAEAGNLSPIGVRQFNYADTFYTYKLVEVNGFTYAFCAIKHAGKMNYLMRKILVHKVTGKRFMRYGTTMLFLEDYIDDYEEGGN